MELVEVFFEVELARERYLTKRFPENQHLTIVVLEFVFYQRGNLPYA